MQNWVTNQIENGDQKKPMATAAKPSHTATFGSVFNNIHDEIFASLWESSKIPSLECGGT